jgi:hypothetical protein
MASRSVTTKSNRLALVALVLLAGCKDEIAAVHRDETPSTPASETPAITPPTPAAAGSPVALGESYRALHAGATVANAVETGKKIWPMLAADARTMVQTAAADSIAALGKMTIKVSAEDIGYKILGETAATRSAFMPTAKVTWRPKASTPATAGTLQLAGTSTVTLEVVREGSVWKLAAGPGLLADEHEIFRMPTGAEAAKGTDTLDAVSKGWQDVLAHGNGWDAYNLMSPAMRKRLLEMTAAVGGQGPADVARIFEKTIVDRRNNGVTVRSAVIEDRTDTRASIVLTYSNGKSDRFVGIRVDGKWWIEMPL